MSSGVTAQDAKALRGALGGGDGALIAQPLQRVEPLLLVVA
jgi:hypothetical protein